MKKAFQVSRARDSVGAIADQTGRVLEYWDYRVIGHFPDFGTTLRGAKAM
jgi:hypothetical protein